jgi:hypothetical protein
MELFLTVFIEFYCVILTILNCVIIYFTYINHTYFIT